MRARIIETAQLKFELPTGNQPIGAVVWCEPQERKDMSVRPSDIGRAIEWFREQTEQELRLILVHPSKEEMAKENSDGIRVETLGGILASEVWLSLAEHFRAPSGTIGFEKEADSEGLVKEPRNESRALR